MARGRGLPLLMAALLSCTLCHAGTYLGCVKLSSWSTFSKDSIGAWSITSCSSICNRHKMPLLALAENGVCYCSAAIPTVAAQVPDAQCKLKAAGVAAVYYRHAGGRPWCRCRRAAAMPANLLLLLAPANDCLGCGEPSRWRSPPYARTPAPAPAPPPPRTQIPRPAAAWRRCP